MHAKDPAFLPVSGFVLPRFAGLPTFMRLPYAPPEDARFAALDIGIVGVPWDNGTTNRPGPRHGPRALRDASTMIRQFNQATGVHPFHLVRCADVGDTSVNPVDVMDAMARIEGFFDGMVAAGIAPLTAGGDHLTSLPVLRALSRRKGAQGPVGMIHFDSHTDFYDSYFGGYRYTHGTPFRRAVEEGILDPKRTVQIGIRGTGYDGEDVEFARSQGVRLFFIEEVMDRGPDAVMAEARAIVGEKPVYVSFDIDGIDPSQAPGTGTPEVGGFSVHQAQRMIRHLAGLDILGADLVEVSPPFDMQGMTSWVGVNIMFELLCPLAQAVVRRGGKA